MVADRILSRGLLIFALLVVFMVALGGLTRLTRSGLSITEWKPVLGALPPITETQWQAEYAKYQKTPEYQKVNHGIAMSRFQFIYFMEWFHRLVGRFLAVLLLAPFFILYVRGLLKPSHVMTAAILLILLAIQGFLGWYMVKSGLVNLPRVNHIRLTIHLLAAMGLLSAAWSFSLYYGFRWKPIPHHRGTAFFHLAWILLALILLQIVFGAFTAGMRAGTISSTWPLYQTAEGASWVPPGLWISDWGLRNLAQHPVAVYFVHRTLAWLVVLSMFAFAWYGLRQHPSRPQKVFLWHLVGLGFLQMLLGVWVVLAHVPVLVASLHQLVAIGIYMAAFYLMVSSRLRPDAK